METILVDPSAEKVPDLTPAAARLGELKGRRIGLLDNIKHNAEYLLDEVRVRLEREYGCEVRALKKKTYTKFCEPPIMAQLAECDAVVTAIGD